ELEAPREPAVPPLGQVVRRVLLGTLGPLLAGDRQDVALDRDVEVLRPDAGHLEDVADVLTRLLDLRRRDPRAVVHPIRGEDVRDQAVEVPPEPIHPREDRIRQQAAIPRDQHGRHLRPGWIGRSEPSVEAAAASRGPCPRSHAAPPPLAAQGEAAGVPRGCVRSANRTCSYYSAGGGWGVTAAGSGRQAAAPRRTFNRRARRASDRHPRAAGGVDSRSPHGDLLPDGDGPQAARRNRSRSPRPAAAWPRAEKPKYSSGMAIRACSHRSLPPRGMMPN